jgi:hypothetical protein
VRRLLPLAILIALALPAAAVALPRQNPADALAAVPIEPSVYDPARHCAPKPHPGMLQLQQWLEANVRGVFWGSYRCERWGRHEASLHAENRAIDWHLDVGNGADRKAADELIALLLAADVAGNPQALARRMSVEELIWNCRYWGAGMDDFIPYSVCFSKRGKRLAHVSKTVAHRDHVHIGMTKAGAAARSSFWRRHTG